MLHLVHNAETLTKAAAYDLLNTKIPKNGIRLVELKRLVLEFGMPFDSVVQLTKNAAEQALKRCIDRRNQADMLVSFGHDFLPLHLMRHSA